MDFVGNILQNNFYGCCYICYQVHALNADAHMPICGAAMLGCNWCRNLAAAVNSPHTVHAADGH